MGCGHRPCLETHGTLRPARPAGYVKVLCVRCVNFVHMSWGDHLGKGEATVDAHSHIQCPQQTQKKCSHSQLLLDVYKTLQQRVQQGSHSERQR